MRSSPHETAVGASISLPVIGWPRLSQFFQCLSYQLCHIAPSGPSANTSRRFDPHDDTVGADAIVPPKSSHCDQGIQFPLSRASYDHGRSGRKARRRHFKRLHHSRIERIRSLSGVARKRSSRFFTFFHIGAALCSAKEFSNAERIVLLDDRSEEH